MTTIKNTTAKFSESMNTPMMQQYQTLKQQNPNSILFFRMGDFYELFLDDAIKASQILNIQLTRRQNSIPMAGVPYHSYHSYLLRLLEAGKTVVIAEQEPDPKNPKLMQRKISRIVSPATVVEEQLMKHNKHNFLMSYHANKQDKAVAIADFSTSDFFLYDFGSNADKVSAFDWFLHFTYTLQPKEILISPAVFEQLQPFINTKQEFPFVVMPDWQCNSKEGVRLLEQTFTIKPSFYEKQNSHPIFSCAGMILHYQNKHYPNCSKLLNRPLIKNDNNDSMYLDKETIAQLDLIHNRHEQGANRTLIKILSEKFLTNCGRRLLGQRIIRPSRNLSFILETQNHIESFATNNKLRSHVRTQLQSVADLERIVNRLAVGQGKGKDFIQLRDTIAIAQSLSKDTVIDVHSNLIRVKEQIHKHVVDDPPNTIDENHPFIRSGICSQLDAARQAKNKSGQLIAEFEKNERTKLAIDKLKVRYNKIYGYFIEISRHRKPEKLPDDYYLRQTLQNQCRYTTQRLVIIEQEIKTASKKILAREKHYFEQLLKIVIENKNAIYTMMKSISELDYWQALAENACEKDWVKPDFTDDLQNQLTIKAGRHPIIEQYLPRNLKFISNDFSLTKNQRLVIISGPNMAGKSTFIRQLAIIQLLAQMGSYVPAQRAQLKIVDRIFTRIGAHDNLSRGESTFFVEMQESARILAQATKNSLIVMDEIGRGTSTDDGYVLAFSILEYLIQEIGAITLFSTHFHELTNIHQENPAYAKSIVNFTLKVIDNDKHSIIFTYKVVPGASNQSHGIHVAQLAGIPKKVIQRARMLLEHKKIKSKSKIKKITNNVTHQKSLF